MKITPGEGTITATNLEAYLYALIKFGQAAERDSTKNPSGVNYLTSNQSDDNLLLSVSINFPFAFTVTSEGYFSALFSDYLSGTGFNPGTGGLLKSQSWVSQVVEAITLLDNAQTSTTKNPANLTLVREYTFNSPSSTTGAVGTFSATLSLPLTETLNADGSTSVSAKEVFG